MKLMNLMAAAPVIEAPRGAALSPLQAMAVARVLDTMGILDIESLLFDDAEMIEAYFEGEAIIEGMARS